MRVELDLGQVGDLERAAGPGRFGRPASTPGGSSMARSWSSRARLLPKAARTWKESLRLVVLHDRAAVGPGQPHGVADDPVQHLVEVEARADGLADLAECLQLRDLAGQLGAPWTRGRASGRPGAARSPPGRRTPPAARVSRSSKGATSVRHTESTPTTSSSRIIGAESSVR